MITSGETNKFYRVLDNPHSNDFNCEPEKIIVPYILQTWSEKKLTVNRCGWGGGVWRKCVIKNDETCFETKELAEKSMNSGGTK